MVTLSPVSCAPVSVVSRPLTMFRLLPALRVVSVWVRPLPLSEPLPLLALALTVRPLLPCPKLNPAPIELP